MFSLKQVHCYASSTKLRSSSSHHLKCTTSSSFFRGVKCKCILATANDPGLKVLVEQGRVEKEGRTVGWRGCGGPSPSGQLCSWCLLLALCAALLDQDTQLLLAEAETRVKLLKHQRPEREVVLWFCLFNKSPYWNGIGGALCLQCCVEWLTGEDYKFDFLDNMDLRYDHKFSCLSVLQIPIIMSCVVRFTPSNSAIHTIESICEISV